MTQESKSQDSQEKKVSEMKRGSSKNMIVMGAVVVLVAAAVYYFTAMESDEMGVSSISKIEGTPDPADMGQWSYANGYAIGVEIKNSMDNQDEFSQVDADIVIAAIADVLLERDPKMTQEQAQVIFEQRGKEQQERFAQLSVENLDAGAAFMETYKAVDDAQEAEDGVYYRVLSEGDGELVGEQTALVLYTGKKTDGSTFDSSEANGGVPLPFASSSVIPGLGQVLELMKVGDKYEVAIPADQAYGEQGSGTVIGPNETLVFEVEITGIQDAAAAAAAAGGELPPEIQAAVEQAQAEAEAAATEGN